MHLNMPVVIEQATLNIVAAQHEKFETALARGYELLAQAKGFQWVQALRQIEDPETYVLLIGWDSREAHTEGFVKSDLYAKWSAEIGPYLTSRPIVAHFHPQPTD